MPQVTIRKVDIASPSLTERIRERAFHLFTHRGEAEGSALEDWLNAEREFLAQDSEFVEKNGKFELQVPVPGFDAAEVQVFVTPEGVTVEAAHSQRQEHTEDGASVSEATENQMFRFIPLPASINADQVTAKMNHGVLKLTAAKAA
jgi:HSP20 family molecular chaperone IbpA